MRRTNLLPMPKHGKGSRNGRAGPGVATLRVAVGLLGVMWAQKARYCYAWKGMLAWIPGCRSRDTAVDGPVYGVRSCSTTLLRTCLVSGDAVRARLCLHNRFCLFCEHDADTAGIVCPRASDCCRQLSSPIASTSPLQQRLRPRAENLRRVLALLITVQRSIHEGNPAR